MSPSIPLDCLTGGGAMGALMRAFDWPASPLGPVEGWPQNLRTAVSICLSLRFPLMIGWGQDLVLLYNDAFRPLLADRHPAALGRPGRDGWDEKWDVLGPALHGAVEASEAAGLDDLPLFDRPGRPEERYFTFSLSPLRDELGGVGGVFVQVIETTERVIAQRAEAALRQSEERFRDLFENANDVIYTLGLDGRITSVNKRAEQTFGYMREECLGRNAAELVPPEYLARMQEALRRKLEGEPAPTTYELEVICKDGHRVPLEVSSRLIVRDGQPVGVQGIARDVTERKRTEQAQRFLAQAGAALGGSLLGPDVTLERVAQLAVPALADWCTIDVLREDHSVRQVAVVPAGLAREERAPEWLHNYPPWLQARVGDVLRTGEPALLPARPDDSEALPGLGLRSCMIVPLSARGRALGAITLVAAESGRGYGPADLALALELARRGALAIDNARLYRELQEAGRRKDDFLAMLAHELRNPLAPIRNAVPVLRLLGLAHPKLNQVRDIIERQVGQLARLVDDLLDVSRISRGKALLRRVWLDLVPLVRAAVEDHRPLLESTGLKLTVDLANGPLWALGDPTRLTQVVGNLLHNANKFTDVGGLVHVRLMGQADGSAAVLTVRDTGIGIERDILRQLFEPFMQADRSLDRARGGLGLGLALVKGLVELHAGSVQAASPGPGQGAELTVRLPLGKGPKKGETAEAHGAGRGRSLRVLVVEDKIDAAESLRLLLQLSGHEAEVAYTGAQGVEVARQQSPDVVICDIGLPGGMDGYGVARTLRADPEQSVATLIALSGYGQEEDQRQARQAGFDRHLTKPVDPAFLMELLAALPRRPDR